MTKLERAGADGQGDDGGLGWGCVGIGMGRVQSKSSICFEPERITFPSRSETSTESFRNVAVHPCTQSREMDERLWLRVLGWKMWAVIVTELLGIGTEMDPREVMWALLGSRTEMVGPEGMR